MRPGEMRPMGTRNVMKFTPARFSGHPRLVFGPPRLHGSISTSVRDRTGKERLVRSGASLAGVIEQLCEGKDLTEEQAKATLYDLVQDDTSTPEQMAAFIVLLRAKGETPAEIAGLAKAMDAHQRQGGDTIRRARHCGDRR